MKLHFLGGSGTVSGSKYLLETKTTKILVDCGLFQGLKTFRLKNWKDFPVDPASIDAVFLTHAHADHCGYLPRLMNLGFNGPIYCTQSTFDLAKIILSDSGFLQEEEARYRNKTKSTKHSPALPLYTELDAKRCLKQFIPIEFSKYIDFMGLRFYFQHAGHILGAASIIIEADAKKVLFSGDVGRFNDSLINAPETCAKVNYIVMESTYGDRVHSQLNPVTEIKKLLNQIVLTKSVLLIPSFAVGRAQSLIKLIVKIFDENPELRCPLFLNSPMANDVSLLYKKYHIEHKLTKEEIYRVFNSIKTIHSVEESKALNLKKGPMVIISASGMLSGGRILHHLKSFAGDPNNKILLVGFQAPGTRGAKLEAGGKEIKIHGQFYPILAEVKSIDSLSAHADQEELIQWLHSGIHSGLKKIFLVHGEPMSSETLRLKIKEVYGVEAEVPFIGDVFELT